MRTRITHFLQWCLLALLCVVGTLGIGAALRHAGIIDLAIAAAGIGATAAAHRVSVALEGQARNPVGAGLRLIVFWLVLVFGALAAFAGGTTVFVNPFADSLSRWPSEYVVVVAAVTSSAVTLSGIAALIGRLRGWFFAATLASSLIVLAATLTWYGLQFPIAALIFWVAVLAVLVALIAHRKPDRRHA